MYKSFIISSVLPNVLNPFEYVYKSIKFRYSYLKNGILEILQIKIVYREIGFYFCSFLKRHC